MKDNPSSEEYADMLREISEDVIEAMKNEDVTWRTYNTLVQRFVYLAFQAKTKLHPGNSGGGSDETR